MMAPIYSLDLTLPTPAENLALDEALLDWAEAGAGRQVLRTWQASHPFVVLGYGNEVARETLPKSCLRLHIPILRRCTGGGTVLQGPGCLNYSLVLDSSTHPELSSVSGTNSFIMERQRAFLQSLLGQAVTVEGHTDLAIGGRKCSGNAQRRVRRFILFHGVFLLAFEMEQMGQVLPLPSRRPGYRQDRSHGEFLTAIDLAPPRILAALRETWHADLPLEDWPRQATRDLAASKYSHAEWNLKR